MPSTDGPARELVVQRLRGVAAGAVEVAHEA